MSRAAKAEAQACRRHNAPRVKSPQRFEEHRRITLARVHDAAVEQRHAPGVERFALGSGRLGYAKGLLVVAVLDDLEAFGGDVRIPSGIHACGARCHKHSIG